MSDFLARMARESRERATQAMAREPQAALRRRAADTPAPPMVSLSPEGFDLIAEIKFRSPSAGALVEERQGRDVAGRARAYGAAGAAVISVLTEPGHFGGDLRDLVAAALAAPVPAMRKDFLVDPYQIWEARACGAAGVLLIVRMLEDEQLGEMIATAAEAGLFVLLEAFDETDLDRITGGSIRGASGRTVWLGVNTRDLASLAVVPARLERLAGRIPPGRTAVAESGIAGPAEAGSAARLGYSLALVGTALMRAADPGDLIASMLRHGRAARTEGADRPDAQTARPARGPERR